MNPVGGQGQPGPPQAGQMAPGQQQNQQQQQQRSPPMYRPEQMRQLPLLSEEEKGKYEKGLAALWKALDTAIPQSTDAIEAKKKIAEFGRMLLQKLAQRRQQVLHAQQNGGNSQQQPNATPPQSVAAGNQKQGPTGAPPTPTTATMSLTAPAPVAPNPAAPAGQPNQQNKPLPTHIQAHIASMEFTAPASTPDKAKWVNDLKMKYGRALATMESMKLHLKRLDDLAKERQEKGNPLTPDESRGMNEKKAHLQKQYQDALGFVNNVRKSAAHQKAQPQNGAPPQNPVMNAGKGPGDTDLAAGAGAGTGNGAGGSVGAGLSSDGIGASNPMQTSAATVNAAFEAAKNQQLAAGRGPNANGLAGQPPPAPQTQAPPPNSQPARASPAVGTPNLAPEQPPAPPKQQQQHQPHIKVEPGTQPGPIPLPAPLNTNISSAATPGLASAGTPTQGIHRIGTPHTATPTTNVHPAVAPPQNQPQALSHSAALNLANQRTNSLPSGSVSGGTPQASSAGVMGTAQGHSNAHASQPVGQTVQPKLPISKNLPERATQVPTPVPTMQGIPGIRPTYSGGSGLPGGVMSQPVMNKIPAYTLDGEGERVLNKKKLDELVRQVCGGTAEGQEGNLLSPEVEESVLNLADSFVDNVLHSACRAAKDRGSKVLEIRDIQVILERTYNIRIPGYSSDELRTVRKVQPNSQWITKMSAVQAAKVMPGKGEL